MDEAMRQHYFIAHMKCIAAYASSAASRHTMHPRFSDAVSMILMNLLGWKTSNHDQICDRECQFVLQWRAPPQ